MNLSTREAYGAALEFYGGKYDILVLDADLSKATKTDLFAAKYPQRFFNIGISEGDMMGTAAGLAASGKTVFVSSFAVFAAGRAFEQVRNSIAYTGLNVKIAATHGGILIGEDGGSHQAIEDITLMRVLPGMSVLCPCDERSTFMAVEAAICHSGPVYLRLGRFPSAPVYSETPAFDIGGANLLTEGGNVAILAIGDMVSAALEAKKMLAADGISAAVADMYSIKPLNTTLLRHLAQNTGAIVTAEDHSVVGGLGGAVAEFLAEDNLAVLRRVGVKDTFGCSGKPLDLAKAFGLTPGAIAAACKEAIDHKRR